MEKIDFSERRWITNTLTTIKYAPAIMIILGASMPKGQDKIQEKNENRKTQEQNIQNIKTGIQKYVQSDDQNFFNWALQMLQEDEYIRQNVRAFMDATIGTLQGEEQVIWEILAINLMFPDSLKSTDYIIPTPRVTMEVDNFFAIYREWRRDRKEYLINKDKIDSQKEKKWLPEFLKKDPKKMPEESNFVEKFVEKDATRDYLTIARETIQKDFPLDKETMNICIDYIEEDPYIKVNIEKLLEKTVGTLPEKEIGKATWEAISRISIWLKKGNETINTTFTERNHIQLSEQSVEQVEKFYREFEKYAIKYFKYAKKTRKF